MSKAIKECLGCAPSQKEHDRTMNANCHHAVLEYGGIDDAAQSSKYSADELLEQLRAANRQVVLQSQRIEELESYLSCIVNLSAKVRELELDASL